MKRALLLLAVCVGGFSQDPPQPVKLTTFLNLTQTTSIDNRSPSTRSNNVHLFRATGTGVWSVQLQFSDASSFGPWTNFSDATSLVTSTSASSSGGAFGNHSFLRILITGAATVSYSGTQNLYIPLGGAGGTVNLATSVTGILPYQNGGALGAPYNIKYSGAVCDGTDQNAAVQAALALGYTNILIPAGCTWTAPGGIIPGGANGTRYIGENWITSVIKSAADPTTVTLKEGPGVVVENMNLRGNTVNSPANCPIAYAVNATKENQNVISTCWSTFDSISGEDNVDRSGVFFKVGAFSTGDTGDAANFSNCVGNNGKPVNPTTGGCLYTGNSMRVDNYSGTPGLAAILATAMPGAATNSAIISLVNYAGSGVNPIMLGFFDTNRTSGPMIQMNQRTSTYNGTVFTMAMADFGGAFTGNFEGFYNGNVAEWLVDSQGVASFGDRSTQPSIRKGTGTPEGAVAAQQGSLFLRSDGGPTSTLYFKGAGGSGGTGWTAAGTGGGGGGGLADPGGNGLVIRTALNTTTNRSIAASTPIVVSNADGTSANPALSCPTCGVTGSPLSQFAPTTSAQLFGIMTNPTGTGLAVFNNSPTLLGTTNAVVLNVSGALTTNVTGGGTQCIHVSNTGAVTGTGFDCGNAVGTVTHTVGALTSGAIAVGNTGADIKTICATCTLDALGNLSTPGTISSGVGGSAAGFAQFGQGAPSTPAANSIVIQAPASVTAYSMALPGAAATGFLLNTDTAGVGAMSFVPSQGNGSKVQRSTGSTTTDNCVKFDVNGNTVDAGAACSSGGGGTTKLWTGSFATTDNSGAQQNAYAWQMNAATGGTCDAITTTAPAPKICYVGLTPSAGQNISYQFTWDSAYTAIDFKFDYFGNYSSPGTTNYRFTGKLICQTLGTVYSSGTWTAGATTTSATSSAAAYDTVGVSMTSIALPTCANGSPMIFQLTRDQSVGSNSTDDARLLTGVLIAH